VIPLGSAVMLVVVITTAVRIGSARHGLHPGVLAPSVVVTGAMLFVPVGLHLGGTWAEAAEWVWVLGALAAVPAANLLGSAVVAHRRLRRTPPSRYDDEECPSISLISEMERSLEDEIEAISLHRTPIPRDAEYR
jgi:hypothetical protein